MGEHLACLANGPVGKMRLVRLVAHNQVSGSKGRNRREKSRGDSGFTDFAARGIFLFALLGRLWLFDVVQARI